MDELVLNCVLKKKEELLCNWRGKENEELLKKKEFLKKKELLKKEKVLLCNWRGKEKDALLKKKLVCNWIGKKKEEELKKKEEELKKKEEELKKKEEELKKKEEELKKKEEELKKKEEELVMTCNWGGDNTEDLVCDWGGDNTDELVCDWGDDNTDELVCDWGKDNTDELVCDWGGEDDEDQATWAEEMGPRRRPRSWLRTGRRFKCLSLEKTRLGLKKARQAKWDRAMSASLEEAKFDRTLSTMFADGGDIANNLLAFMSSIKTDILISGKGEEVPISYLEGKVFGLYFYSDRTTSARLIFELKHMYKKLRDGGENFELVFVCLHRERPNTPQSQLVVGSYEESLEKSFKRYFQGNTWLSLPFSQTKTNRELYRAVESLAYNECYRSVDFVIIQPGAHIPHTRPMRIYRDYGIEAYPFSQSRVIEIEVARFKSLTLEQVLFSGAEEKFVYDHHGQKISASHLVGKNILLFLTRHPANPDDTLCADVLKCEKVSEWYKKLKHNDEAFEIVRVFYKDKDDDQTLEEASKRYNKETSWLNFPDDKYDMDALYSKLLKKMGNTYCYSPMCVAFGRDGRFVTMKILSSSLFGESDGYVDYDCLNFFDAGEGDLYAQVRKYIRSVNNSYVR